MRLSKQTGKIRKVYSFLICIALCIGVFCVSAFAVDTDTDTDTDVVVTYPSCTGYADGVTAGVTFGQSYGVLGGLLCKTNSSPAGLNSVTYSASGNDVVYNYGLFYNMPCYIAFEDGYDIEVTCDTAGVTVVEVSPSDVDAAYSAYYSGGERVAYSVSGLSKEGYRWFKITGNEMSHTTGGVITVHFVLRSVIDAVFEDGVDNLFGLTLSGGDSIISFILANDIMLVGVVFFLASLIFSGFLILVHFKRR